MVSRLYFAIHPRPALVAKLESCGLCESLGMPELWSKQQFDRVPEVRDNVLQDVKDLYTRDFRSHLRIELELQPALQSRIDLADFPDGSFDRWWEMEVFEDCDEFERVAKEP